jgi:hypothetical protein
VRVLAYMGGLAILAIAAFVFFRNSAVVAAIQPTPQPQWIKVERPFPAFELLMPELARGPYSYSVLRRDADGARKDVLNWGNAAGNGPYVTVEIYRPGNEDEPFLDADSEIAARIVDYTVTDDVKPAGRIESKFGTVPLVDFAIAAQGHEHRCLGFARPFTQPSMQIAGWYCSPGNDVVVRAALACVIDRLTIVSAGGDARLDAMFARAEMKRTFCGQRNPILAATPERAPAPTASRNMTLRNFTLRQRLE